MESGRRGLLVLFEGFPPTVIRSQVVALAGWLARGGLMRFDLLSVACSAAVHRQGQAEASAILETLHRDDPAAEVTLLRGVRPALPGAGRYHRWLLRRHLDARPGRFHVLHARTDYAAAVCDAAIFVSRVLGERFSGAVRGPCRVIPTVADGDRFRFDPALRRATRDALGYAEGQPVFVFSGTLSAYQGFDAAVRCFARVAADRPSARMLVLTPALAKARARLAGLDPRLWQALRAPFDDMNRLLNAADFAFLTRPASPVNVAAFPTKFAEYGLAGLQVVMSDATPDCVVHARRAGNLVPVDGAADVGVPARDAREAVAAYYRRHLTTASFRDDYAVLYGAS